MAKVVITAKESSSAHYGKVDNVEDLSI